MLEDYYQTKSVNKGRKEYTCSCCGGPIPENTPSDLHSFYPFDFSGFRTHKECTEKFLNGYFCSYCGKWIENGKQKKYENKIICENCYNEEIIN